MRPFLITNATLCLKRPLPLNLHCQRIVSAPTSANLPVVCVQAGSVPRYHDNVVKTADWGPGERTFKRKAQRKPFLVLLESECMTEGVRQ